MSSKVLRVRAHSMLAVLSFNQGRLHEARSQFKACLELSRRDLGETHRQTLMVMCSVANVLASGGRFDEADALSKVGIFFSLSFLDLSPLPCRTPLL